LFVFSLVRLRQWLRIRRVAAGITAGSLLVVSLLVTGAASYNLWYRHRPVPSDSQRVLFEGVTYIRDARSKPRPLVVHVVTIDLTSPGISFLVTPPEPTNGYHLRARTTSEFVTATGVHLAINAGFFSPWRSNTPFDYYPHAGDPVNISGIASSRGTVYSTERGDRQTMYISKDNKVQFNAPTGGIYNAVSGDVMFLVEGNLQTRRLSRPDRTARHPRTAVALDKSGRKLLFFVVDGRQPNYSEGATIPEMADIVLEYGGYTALNLDGGGSSALILRGADGKPIQLNTPIDHGLVGHERPVGNHLGIYAQTLVASRP
jgi:hypothetical protein